MKLQVLNYSPKELFVLIKVLIILLCAINVDAQEFNQKQIDSAYYVFVNETVLLDRILVEKNKIFFDEELLLTSGNKSTIDSIFNARIIRLEREGKYPKSIEWLRNYYITLGYKNIKSKEEVMTARKKIKAEAGYIFLNTNISLIEKIIFKDGYRKGELSELFGSDNLALSLKNSAGDKKLDQQKLDPYLQIAEGNFGHLFSPPIVIGEYILIGHKRKNSTNTYSSKVIAYRFNTKVKKFEFFKNFNEVSGSTIYD